MRSEMMKTRAPHLGRNGRILSHAMRLWMKYEIYNRVAVLLRTLVQVSKPNYAVDQCNTTIHIQVHRRSKRTHVQVQEEAVCD